MPKKYKAVGRCIYCGRERYSSERTRLGLEHIVPESLGGDWELPEASCKDCETRINQSEQFCSKQMLSVFRAKFGLPSKRPKNRPTSFDAHQKIRGVFRPVKLSADEFPIALLLPLLSKADMLRPYPVRKTTLEQFHPFPGDAEIVGISSAGDAVRSQIHKGEYVAHSGPTDCARFARMLAKIAHSYATAELGYGGFNAFLPALALNKRQHPLYWFIGGEVTVPEPETQRHILDLSTTEIHDRRFLTVKVRLFADLGWPKYECIVGTPLGERPRPIRKLVKASHAAQWSLTKIVCLTNSSSPMEGLDSGFDQLCAHCGDIITCEAFDDPAFILQCGKCKGWNIAPPEGNPRTFKVAYEDTALKPDIELWSPYDWSPRHFPILGGQTRN